MSYLKIRNLVFTGERSALELYCTDSNDYQYRIEYPV